ncbi:anti-sigma factor family protein [Candidatus Neomarinimicrobiota bacterium]
MKGCRTCKRLMVDALYHELNSRQQKTFDQHLVSCSICAAEYEQLSWTLKVMDHRQIPAIDTDYWQNYWARLSDRLPEKTPRVFWPDWRSWFPPVAFPGRPALIPLIAALLLIATGIFIGRTTLLHGPGPGAAIQATVFDPSLISEFNELASSYLERSKMVLMGLDNFDPRSDDPAALNVSRHRDLSQELLHQGRMLRNHQVAAADPRLQILIDEIERVLLQVANSSGEDPMWTVRMAQEGIDKNSILLRITLEEIGQTEKSADEDEPQVKTSSFLT